MKFNKNYNLYKITNTKTQMAYVGIVRGRTTHQRFLSHLSTARSNGGYFLHEAIRAEGEKYFMCEHIACAKDLDALNELEKHLINEHETLYPMGYNRTTGGSGDSKKGITIFFRDKWWLSIAHLARAYNLDVNTVTQRYRRYNWSLDQSLGLNNPPKRNGARGIPVTFQNKKYPSLRSLCNAFEINEEKVRSNLASGWNLRQALNIDPRPVRRAHNAKGIFLDDNYFQSISDACKFYKVRKDKYYDRKRSGWTARQIFGLDEAPKKIHPNAKPIMCGVYSFPSMEDATRYFQLYEHAVSERLRACWTIEEALGLVRRSEDHRKGKHPNSIPIIINGIKYPSLSVAANIFKVSRKTLIKRHLKSQL